MTTSREPPAVPPTRAGPPAGPPTPAELPGRAELAERTREVLSRGGPRNPDVLLVEIRDGRSIVVKDFAPRAGWVRATIGRLVTAREVRALQALTGHPDVPRLLGPIDPLAFAVELRPGRKMSRRLATEVPPAFLDRLERAVREMHARGVVHLDLRHRSNVLLGRGGEPILVDFGSALAFRPGGWLARGLLPWLARIDLGAVAKWRRKLTPPAPRDAGGQGALPR